MTHPIVNYTSPSSWALVRDERGLGTSGLGRDETPADRGQDVAVREGDSCQAHQVPRGMWSGIVLSDMTAQLFCRKMSRPLAMSHLRSYLLDLSAGRR